MSVEVKVPESFQVQNVSSEKNNRIPVGLRVFLYILLTFLMTVIISLLTIIISVRGTVTKDNIYSFIKNTEYMTIKAEDSNGYELTLYEMMCSQFNTENLERDSFYKIIDQTGLEEKLAEYVYSYAAFILYDESLDEINEKTILNLYNKNLDKIEKALGIKLNDNDKKRVEDEVKNQTEIFDMLSEYSIEETLGAGLSVIRFLVSVPGIIVLSVAAAVILALLIIISKSVCMPVRVTGSVLSVFGLAGLIVLILTVSGHFVVDLSKLTVESIIYQSAAGVFAPVLIRIMGYILSIGIILILASFIVRVITSDINSKIKV